MYFETAPPYTSTTCHTWAFWYMWGACGDLVLESVGISVWWSDFSLQQVFCKETRPDNLPAKYVVVVVVVSHIQRIGCQPEKTTLHGGQSRSWSAEQGKENKRKSLAAYPPPPTPHTARSEKINKITRRIYRRYAGGRSRVRTRIPAARRLGLWVWLRKILHSRLR